MDSIISWLILMLGGLSGVFWLLLQIAEHERQRTADSERLWEEVSRNAETDRLLHCSRTVDRRVYPRYADDVS